MTASRVRLRLWMDFDGCSLPVPQEEYFPDDLFAVQPGEVIVDCGAFDGDTLRAFARRCPEFGRIITLEPDPANYSKLCACREALPNGHRVTCLCLAAGSERGLASFVASGSEVSRLGESGFEVEIAPLDEILRNEKPTYIKMDVEGAEPGVLAGCIDSIQVHNPILAISVYHCPDHLWTLPLQVRAMSDGYRFYLRPHDEQGIGLACYALPESRHHRSV